jgi:hypothetical protein
LNYPAGSFESAVHSELGAAVPRPSIVAASPSAG